MSSVSDEVQAVESSGSPGSRLQKAREAMGLSQKSLADDLYLPRNYIIWIEEGAYDKLPSMVFCRGYIRAYAKAVNENGQELIELLDSVYGVPNTKSPLKSISKINEQVKVGDPIMKWPSLLFILVLLGVVFWWWKTQYGLSAPIVSSQDPVAVETVNGSELVLPSLADSSVSADAMTQSVISTPATQGAVVSSANSTELTVAAGLSVDLSPVVSSQENVVNNGIGIDLALNIDDSETQSQSDAQLAELEQVVKSLESEEESAVGDASELPAADNSVKLLQLTFNNDCWITIKDVRGKILFNGIKKSGQKLSLSGDAPLKLSIGRVDSVSKITYGGVNINIAALGRNNIANFKLPL